MLAKGGVERGGGATYRIHDPKNAVGSRPWPHGVLHPSRLPPGRHGGPERDGAVAHRHEGPDQGHPPAARRAQRVPMVS